MNLRRGWNLAVLTVNLISLPAYALEPQTPITDNSQTSPSAGAQSKALFSTFNTKVTTSKTYTVKPLDEELSHDLLIKSGTYSPYKLYLEYVDKCPIVIRLSVGAKVLLNKQLPRWQGLCEPHFAFIDPRTDADCNQDPVVGDIDGDGKPELIIMEISEAGGHPPSKLSIYRLDGAPVLKQTFNADLVDPSFKDIDNDGKYEILAGDDTFAYWLDSAGFQRIDPKVALVFDGTTYKPSAKQTKIAAPTKAELDKLVADLNKEIAPFKKKGAPAPRVIMPSVWNQLIKLVYSGNADSARTLLSTLYPGTAPVAVVTTEPPIPAAAEKVSKAVFWSRLCTQAKKSKFASILTALNPSLATPPN